MAPPQFLAGAAFVTFYWTYNAQLAVTRLGMQVLGGVTFGQGLADGLGGVAKGAFTQHLQPLMPGNAALVRVGVRDWRTAHQPEFRDTAPQVTGAGVGDMLPAQLAICVTLRTALAGKSFRGRVYLGGFLETHNDAASRVSAAATAGVLGFLDACDDGFESFGLRTAVVSKPAEDVQLIRRTTTAAGDVIEDIISHQVAKTGSVNDVVAFEARNSTWETQRRRANERGGGVSLLTSAGIIRKDVSTA